MEEQAQQFGGQLPPQLQQQFQMEIENQVAEKIVEMTEALVAEEQEYLDSQNSDPLIDLKQQELNIRSQEIQQNKLLAEEKLDLDVEKLNFEGEKLQQKDDMDKEKLQSQEDQADLRAEVTLAGQRGRDGNR
jgi:hypothetical protein